jgi:hypothetical protein
MRDLNVCSKTPTLERPSTAGFATCAQPSAQDGDLFIAAAQGDTIEFAYTP